MSVKVIIKFNESTKYSINSYNKSNKSKKEGTYPVQCPNDSNINADKNNNSVVISAHIISQTFFSTVRIINLHH